MRAEKIRFWVARTDAGVSNRLTCQRKVDCLWAASPISKLISIDPLAGGMLPADAEVEAEVHEEEEKAKGFSTCTILPRHRRQSSRYAVGLSL